ncbi:MAG: APC family permease [Patescibacteria group bacterium]
MSLFKRDKSFNTFAFNRKKQQGLLGAILFSIGSIIGGGIFALTGISLNIAGPGAIVSYVIAFFIILISAISYAQLSALYISDGGGYLFIKRLLGNFLGFISGWAIYISGAIFIAFVLSVFGDYMSTFFIHGIHPIYFSFIALIFLMILAYLDLSDTKWFEGVLVIVTIFILFLFGLFGVAHFNISHFSNFFPYGGGGVFKVIGILFISFMGFQVISNMEVETRDPKKNIPRAIILSLIFVLVIYLLVVIATISDLGSNFNVASVGLAAEKSMGTLGFLIPLAALFATLSTANSNIISTTRTISSMALENQISSKFVKLNKYDAPKNSLIFIFLVTSLFLLVNNINFLVEVAATIVMFIFILINFATVMLHIKFRDIIGEKTFKRFGGEILPLLGVVATVVMLLSVSILSFIVALLLVFMGIFYYEKKNIGRPSLIINNIRKKVYRR